MLGFPPDFLEESKALPLKSEEPLTPPTVFPSKLHMGAIQCTVLFVNLVVKGVSTEVNRLTDRVS